MAGYLVFETWLILDWDSGGNLETVWGQSGELWSSGEKFSTVKMTGIIKYAK